MKDITFVDLEVTLNTCRVVDIGAVRSDRTPFHENSFDNLLLFLHQVPYIGGHNILKHDLSYLKPQFEKAGCRQPKIIDTLYLSSLLFPEKLHHQLSKDDKLQADKPNNPVNDSLKSLLLFEEEQNAFERLDSMLKMIYYGLLHDTDEFGGFFDYIDYAPDILDDLSGSILERFSKDICISSPLAELITSYPVELAYGLSLINCWNSSSGIPLWVLHNYPKVGWVMERLRDTPCENNECAYCRGAFNGKEGLKYFFKYDSFRTYEGEDLQQKAVEAAIEGESLLAVFPTGGGKSITFQLPALMSGKRIKGLTVVISPLQSLMKDQVDNLWKNEIMDVVTILVDEYGARTHDLLVNFRSKKCLVEFANRFWETIPERMKQSRIISHDQDEGEIRIVQYQSPNMVIPLVQDICATPLIGTTCVLTQTNWEAIQVACLLKDKRMPVRLIQSNEGFRLCDMDEMRFFNRILGSQAEVHLIDEVCWAEAKQAIKNEYCEAASWEICRGIIQNFEQLYPCKYRSDWETYLFESKLEDFYAVRGETIVVSTIHKAKGKEFDNVFLLLNDNRDLLGDNQPVTDEKRREIYVALTRAKNKLSIHLNSYYPEIFGNEEKIIRFDKAYYPMPERLLFLLTHRDVWLDFFKDARRQESIGNLKSGMPLRLMEGGCCDSSDKEVVRFSNSFKKEIEKWLDKGYELKEARVNFVVYWKKTGEEEEVKVLLPEIVLVKVRNLNVSELMIL